MAQDVNGSNASRFAETDEEAERRFNEFRSKDPFPSIPPALLNSADIADYVAATGMICPFNDSNGRLKSASYRVDILGECMYWDENGKEEKLDIQPNEKLILEPNSIVFVAVQPTFRIPDYIALRFNLKIDHVYKGLLVGTGPLVDPGFVGKLYLPLHNLTANTYTLTGGEPIIWMEFTKLSPNKVWKTAADSKERVSDFIGFPEQKKKKGLNAYLFDAAGRLSIRSSIPDTVEKANKQAAEARSTSIDAKANAETAKQEVLTTKSQVKEQLTETKVEFEQLKTAVTQDVKVAKAETDAKIKGVTRWVSSASVIVTLFVIGASFFGIILPSYNLVKTTTDNLLRTEIDLNLKKEEIKELQGNIEVLKQQVSGLENKLNSLISAASRPQPKTTRKRP